MGEETPIQMNKLNVGNAVLFLHEKSRQSQFSFAAPKENIKPFSSPSMQNILYYTINRESRHQRNEDSPHNGMPIMKRWDNMGNLYADSNKFEHYLN